MRREHRDRGDFLVEAGSSDHLGDGAMMHHAPEGGEMSLSLRGQLYGYVLRVRTYAALFSPSAAAAQFQHREQAPAVSLRRARPPRPGRDRSIALLGSAAEDGEARGSASCGGRRGRSQPRTLGVIGWRLVNFWLPIPVGAGCYISLRGSRQVGPRRTWPCALRTMTNEARVTAAETPAPDGTVPE